MTKKNQPAGPSAALVARMQADKTATPEDRLEGIRSHLRIARDTAKEILDTEARLKTLKEEQVTRLQKDLPDLFDEANIDKLGLPAEGNLPAYDCKLDPYYHASISADWPEEKRTLAFDYLAGAGAEDLVKSLIIIALPRGERKTAKKVEAGLEKAGVPYVTKLDVPWNTLTAWVKEQVEKNKTLPKLDLIGATVGRVVKLKERK